MTLVFERAGAVDVKVIVQASRASSAASAPSAPHRHGG
jgi:hypothetical protein